MSADWVVCIPSYKRPAILLKKTLKTLLEGNVPEDRIRIYVADETEAITYRAWGVKPEMVVVGVPGLVAQRQYIQDQLPLGQKIMFFDDDVSQVKQLVDGKLVKVKDIKVVIDRGFSEMEAAKANIWGVYPVPSALYMSNEITTDLRWIIGCMYGIRNTRGPSIRYSDSFEDKERTLRYWLKDGVLVRLNDIAYITRFYAPGGLDTPDRKKNTEKDTLDLCEAFPGFLIRHYKKKQGVWDIKLKRQTPSKRVPPEHTDTTIEHLPLSDDYVVARDKLLIELKKVRIPKLGNPTVAHRRKKHGTRADNIGSIGRTATLGFGNTRYRGIGEFSYNKKWPELFRTLVEFGNLIAPPDWTYTAITLNHGVQARKHKDNRNVGKSIIIGIGDYTGGALRVWDPNDENPQDLDLKDKPTMFNGALLPHETQPFTGDRYTIIYYRQQYKGTCAGVPLMIGKSVLPVEDGKGRPLDAHEGVSDELFGGDPDDSKIHVV